MVILCSECGYRLQAESGGIGAFGMVDFFDDGPDSDAHGEQVTWCPGCGLWLYYGFGMEPSDVVQPG